MADKALISDLTWRSLKMQKDAFPDMPHFIAPDEIPQLLRPTNRNGTLNIHILSWAIVADNEKDFVEFLKLVKKRKAEIHCHEEALSFTPKCDLKYYIDWWRKQPKAGSAKIGARNSADKKKANSKEAADKIKERWPLPSKEWPTSVLLKEAGVSLNTVKSVLGKRPIAQYNHQAKQKRAANKVKK